MTTSRSTKRDFVRGWVLHHCAEATASSLVDQICGQLIDDPDAALTPEHRAELTALLGTATDDDAQTPTQITHRVLSTYLEEDVDPSFSDYVAKAVLHKHDEQWGIHRHTVLPRALRHSFENFLSKGLTRGRLTALVKRCALVRRADASLMP